MAADTNDLKAVMFHGKATLKGHSAHQMPTQWSIDYFYSALHVVASGLQ